MNAIAQYIQQQSLESALVETLPALTQKLNQLGQKFDLTVRLDESLQRQAVKAIAQYIQQQNLESALIETLPALTQKLNQLTQNFDPTSRLDKSLQRQAVKAIANYLQQQSLESALVEHLPALSERLNQLKRQFDQATQLDKPLQEKAVKAIANYLQQQSLESALVETLPTLTEQLNQLTHNPQQIAHLDESLQAKAIEAIAQYLQQQSLESTLIENLPVLTHKLNQLSQHEYRQSARLDKSLQTQAVKAIANYLQQQSIESAFSEHLPALTQKLNQLTQKFDPAARLDKSLQTHVVNAIANYLQQQSIESLLIEHLPALSEQLHQPKRKFDQTLRLDESLQTQAIDAIAQGIEQQEQKGGDGTVNLDLHVQQQNFKQAASGLSGTTNSLPPSQENAPDLPRSQQQGGEIIPSIKEWQRVAQALNKSQHELNCISAMVERFQAEGTLPETVRESIQQDEQAYKQLSQDLWQWHEAAKALGKPEEYLHKITQTTIAFHHPSQPIPLPDKAIAAMRQDTAQYENLRSQQLWQHYSQNTAGSSPMKTAFTVALAARKDGHAPEKIYQILRHDPVLVKIRQQSGEQAARNHLTTAIRSTNWVTRSHQKPYQATPQQQNKQRQDLDL